MSRYSHRYTSVNVTLNSGRRDQLSGEKAKEMFSAGVATPDGISNEVRALLAAKTTDREIDALIRANNLGGCVSWAGALPHDGSVIEPGHGSVIQRLGWRVRRGREAIGQLLP